MKQWLALLGLLLGAAIFVSTAGAQAASFDVVQSSDGTLYLERGNTAWTIVPNVVQDSDLAGLTSSGEVDGAIPAALLQAPGAVQLSQAIDGSLYLIRDNSVWLLVPNPISDADLATLTWLGELDGVISTQDPTPVAPTASPTPVTYVPLQIPHSSPPLAAVTHRVLPHDTDSTIDATLRPHLANVASSCVQPSGYLVLYLPGTGGLATGPDAVQMLNVATQDCLHGISLSYPDATAVATDCLRDPDPDCFEKWRLQKLDGVQRSPHLTVTPANSIENLLGQLLRYLARTYPAENWGMYLDDTGVRWDHIVVAGLSQGGGMAGIIGHVHLTARVVMFGSITDAVGGLNGPSPAWVAKASATPLNRYFGFAHMQDQFWPAEQKNWAALSLDQFGPIVNVDTTPLPFGGSHTLTTNIPFDTSVPNGAHPTVVMPRNASIFGKIWEYLLVTG